MTQCFLKQLSQFKSVFKNKGLFITGTDTDVGKTVFTWQLAKYLKSIGEKVIIFKPVECEPSGQKDSDFYKRMLGLDSCECLYSFDRPVSPHCEVRSTGIKIDLDKICDTYQGLISQYDYVIVEGAGGIFCPLGEDVFMLDLISRLQLPNIVVLKNRVGCLNHTLLSVVALQSRNLLATGLVVNGDDNLENIQDVSCLSKVPVLAVMPEISII